MLKKPHSAQILLEHVLLIGVVLLALIAMGPMMRRTLQSVIKITADEIGAQKDSDQDFNSDRGYLVESNTQTTYSRKIRHLDIPGLAIKNILEEVTDTTTFTITNLGFTEEN